MENTGIRKKQILKWALVIIWMSLIFFLSHQPAEDSGALSGGLLDKLLIIIGFIENIINYEFNREVLHLILRKGAHFTAYMILGMLLINAMAENKNKKKELYAHALFVSIIFAITDEIHQICIPGRSGEITDVLIDSAGAFTGLCVCSIFKKYKTSSSKEL